ncbi:MurR/RpiR family transcriptional regulator [Microvirga sp. 17 mud 1-3]|uniref:MurR/RpiR family transcriptional regulator n=1 Tax=Microvirga sp. 17 mud 1-3 TaxID=2082949 RepID=UPI000D6C4586|nr:MurR/RpiR family transcriptional regulator [Microvirga sp. 17 mud 1-3]AWM88534.1 MurR/RpiR family transcriptional regulator [Microvirga sp. 17 mud 1-3]
MNRPANLIETIEHIAPSLKKAERRVADLVLQDIEGTTRSSIKSFAAQAEVSEPTVMRFARRMGCDGFSDFKMRLAQDYAVGRMYIEAERRVQEGDAGTTAQRVYQSGMNALSTAFGSLQEQTLSDAATILANARQIVCLGVGGSSAIMAQEMENRLFRFGLSVTASADPYKQQMLAAIADKGDAFLIFSVTGKPQSLVDAARTAAGRGAAVIAVTLPASPLAQRASLLVPLAIPGDEVHFNFPNRTRYGQLLVIDCLSALVGAMKQPVSARKLHRIRTTLLALHGHTEAQPIGD